MKKRGGLELREMDGESSFRLWGFEMGLKMGDSSSEGVFTHLNNGREMILTRKGNQDSIRTKSSFMQVIISFPHDSHQLRSIQQRPRPPRA